MVRAGTNLPKSLLSIAILVMIGSQISLSPAFAQVDEPWAEPLNLSQSGGATNPGVVVDSNGDIHIFWEEAFARLSGESSDAVYVKSGSGGWTEPIRLELPFLSRPSVLLPDDRGMITALWTDEEGRLLFKQARAVDFGNAASWLSPLSLTTSVVAFDAVLDEGGRIHLAYLRAEDSLFFRPGIYFQRSSTNTDNWSQPLGLYTSDYFRRYSESWSPRPLTGTIADILPSLDIEVEGTENIHVTWDNPPLKRTFWRGSEDSGLTWESLSEVDGPDIASPYASPRQIQIIAIGGNLLRLWQIHLTGGSCSQVYQVSSDGGESWSETKTFLAEFGTCPQSMQRFELSDSEAILLFELQNQTYLVSWNGTHLSLPQRQPQLNYFIDEATYNFVEYGCRHASVMGEQLIIVGCDQGEGSDIWLTERSLTDTSTWYSPTSGWTIQGVVPIEQAAIQSLAVDSDSRGNIHVLISQMEGDLSSGLTSTIYQVRGDKQGLLGPFPVIRDLPGKVSELRLAIDDSDSLLALWSGGQFGDLFYSRTSAQEAGSDASWFSPELIQPTNPDGRSPHLALSPEGDTYLAYAIAINESRGIYFAQSADHGQTWGEVVRVFEAATTDCEMVEASSLAFDAMNVLHILWTCSTTPGGVGPLSLHYSRSEDGGATWAPAEALINRPAVWSQVIGAAPASVLIVWQEEQGERVVTRYAISSDSGTTWSEPASLIAIDGEVAHPSLIADDAGSLHFLQAVQQDGESPFSIYSQWNGQSWERRADLALRTEHLDVLAGAINGDQQLVVAYAGVGPKDLDGIQQPELALASITIILDFPAVAAVDQDTEIGTEDVSTDAAPIGESPEQEPEAEVQTLVEVPAVSSGGSTGLIIGGLAAVVLIVGFLGVRLWFIQTGRALPGSGQRE